MIEAIKHAAWHLNTEVDLKFINTEDIEKQGVKLIGKPDGIIVPIGWGSREPKVRFLPLNMLVKRKYLIWVCVMVCN